MGETHTDDTPKEWDFVALKDCGLYRKGRAQALREALEQIGAIKLKYAIFGRPDDGQLEKAITEIEAKLDEIITNG